MHRFARCACCGLATLDMEALAGKGRVSLNGDDDPEAVFEINQAGPLVVENVERNLEGATRDDIMARIAGKMFLDGAEYMQCYRRMRAHMAKALAMRAYFHRAFHDGGTYALARHFHQAEMRYPPDLNARAIILERFLQALFHRAVVAVFFHVDEIDNDQASKVAQTQLPRHFVRSLEIGLDRSVLDRMLAC